MKTAFAREHRKPANEARGDHKSPVVIRWQDSPQLGYEILPNKYFYCYQPPTPAKDLVCSTGFNVVKPDENRLWPKFAFYVFISDYARQYFEAVASPVHPREVFADALSDRASAVIVAHNHPSGGLEPSTSDINITAQLKAAGAIVGIELLDHIIFNRTGYFSFLEAGRL